MEEEQIQEKMEEIIKLLDGIPYNVISDILIDVQYTIREKLVFRV